MLGAGVTWAEGIQRKVTALVAESPGPAFQFVTIESSHLPTSDSVSPIPPVLRHWRAGWIPHAIA